jgi:integrase
MTYLNVLLPYFSWLSQFSNYQGNLICLDAEPDRIREAVHDYLIQKLECKIRDYNGSFKAVNLTADSPKTIRIFLSALKKFYAVMMREGMYLYSNPLKDAHRNIVFEFNELAAASELRPRMPDIAGTEYKSNPRYLTDSYFVVTGEHWAPEIIDDPQLPAKVFKGGERAGWLLRDQLIARMLFESGARVTEVIKLTVGDYRKRLAVQEFWTFNKGSNGRKVKFIRLSNDTITLFHRYMNGERKQNDKRGLTFNDLPDEAPIFITLLGAPYNYNAWYFHWCRGCAAASIKMNPHKARHWYVTQALREIYETTQQEGEIQRRINQLVEYIKWKNKETIQVYEHYFDAKHHREIQDRLFQKMHDEVITYVQTNEQSRIRIDLQPSSLNQSTIIESNNKDFLSDFFSD